MKQSALLPYVELRRADHSSACYSSHTHDEFSFGIIDRGASCYLNSGHRHELTVGDTVTINPGAVHSCNPQDDLWSYRMLFIDAGRLADWQQQSGLSVTGYALFQSACRRDSGSFRLIAQLFELLAGHGEVLEAEVCLLELVQRLFSPGHDLSSVAMDQPGILRAQELIIECCDQPLTLDQLCQVSGLSRHHLVRSFKQAYGLPPHAYQLDQRIKRAKRLLRSGERLTEVAQQLGFADQAHFQRHFKRRLAVTPKQYQSCFVRP